MNVFETTALGRRAESMYFIALDLYRSKATVKWSRQIRDLEDLDWAKETLDGDLVQGSGMDALPDVRRCQGSLRDEDPIVPSDLRQARGQVDMIADDCVFGPGSRPDVAYGYISGADPDPNIQLFISMRGPFRSDAAKLLAHLKSGHHGSLRVILKWDRVPEEREDPIADVLVQRAAVVEGHVGHYREVLIEAIDQLLGLQSIGHRREPSYVGEEDGQIAAGRGQR